MSQNTFVEKILAAGFDLDDEVYIADYEWPSKPVTCAHCGTLTRVKENHPRPVAHGPFTVRGISVDAFDGKLRVAVGADEDTDVVLAAHCAKTRAAALEIAKGLAAEAVGRAFMDAVVEGKAP